MNDTTDIMMRDDEQKSFSLLDIIEIDTLQRLQDTFSAATGVATIILDENGRTLTRPSNFNPVCRLIQQTDEGRRRCDASDAARSRQAESQSGPTYHRCLSCGFVDACIPIMVGDRRLAFWLVGQSNVLGLTRDHIAAFAEEIGADAQAMLAAFETVPEMSAAKFEQVLNLLYHIAGELSSLAFHNHSLSREIAHRKAVETALRESEELYKRLFANNHTVMLLIDPESGDIVDANSAACRFYGYDRVALTALKIYDINILTDAEIRCEMDRARSERRSHFLLRHRLAGGDVRDVEVFSGPILRKGRQLLYSIIHDITDRRQIERMLRFTQFLVDHSADAAFWMGSDARFVYVNEAACRSLGYSRDELLKMTVHDIDPDFPWECWDDHWRELRQKKSMTLETHHKTKSGRLIPIEIRAKFVEFDGNEYDCAFARDITERKKQEKELARAQRLESIGILAGGIAHDFNNLLTGILGNISLARSDPQPDTIAETLEMAEKAAMRAARLTKQLLTFSRGGAPVKQITDVVELVRETISYALMGSDTPTQLVVGNEIYPVEVDQDQIGQVLHNLILNADQAMAQGGTITIEIANVPTADGGLSPLPDPRVRIAIHDDGIGIPPENVDKIFDPYFTSRETVGHGLGLAVVHSIVGQHDGVVDVESVPGIGTTFSVYLPACPHRRHNTRPPAKVRAAAAGRRVNRGRILVMDDEGFVRDIAARTLTRYGFNVDCTTGGEEAVERYRRSRAEGRPHQVIILDLNIAGGVGGLETFERLKAIQPDIKAVVCSGLVNNPVMTAPEEHGFSAAIAKPFKPQTLIDAVMAALPSPDTLTAG